MFQILAYMYPSNRYFGSKLKFVWLYMNFIHFDKFEGAYFKCDNSFFKILPKKPKWGIFFPKFQVLWFSILQNLRVLISNMTIVFSSCYPKHPNKAILVPDLKILNFAWDFVFWKTWVCFKCCKFHFHMQKV